MQTRRGRRGSNGKEEDKMNDTPKTQEKKMLQPQAGGEGLSASMEDDGGDNGEKKML